MERSVKIILFVIVGLLVVNFLFTIFGNNTISSIRKNLETAKRSADSALNEIKYSQSKLDSIKFDMVNFRSKMSNIQQTVETNDQDKRVQEQRDVARITVLKNSINDLKPDFTLEPVSLPNIDVRNLEK